MVLAEPEVLQAMEHSALEKPCFLPIEVKKGGTITGGLASAAQLGKLGQYVERLLHEITDELSSGNINADPWQPQPAGEQLRLVRVRLGVLLRGRARQAAHDEKGQGQQILALYRAGDGGGTAWLKSN